MEKCIRDYITKDSEIRLTWGNDKEIKFKCNDKNVLKTLRKKTKVQKINRFNIRKYQYLWEILLRNNCFELESSTGNESLNNKVGGRRLLKVFYRIKLKQHEFRILLKNYYTLKDKSYRKIVESIENFFYYDEIIDIELNKKDTLNLDWESIKKNSEFGYIIRYFNVYSHAVKICAVCNSSKSKNKVYEILFDGTCNEKSVLKSNLDNYKQIWEYLFKNGILNLKSITLEEIKSDEEFERKYGMLAPDLNAYIYYFYFRIEDRRYYFKVHDIKKIRNKKYSKLLSKMNEHFKFKFDTLCKLQLKFNYID
jgi:hypothetical protein